MEIISKHFPVGWEVFTILRDSSVRFDRVFLLRFVRVTLSIESRALATYIWAFWQAPVLSAN